MQIDMSKFLNQKVFIKTCKIEAQMFSNQPTNISVKNIFSGVGGDGGSREEEGRNGPNNVCTYE
jgi:hypothetical protein